MAATARARPDATEFAPFYASYVAIVPDGDIVDALRQSGREIGTTLSPVAESRGGFRYAAEKWTVREVVGHMIDAERIFAYRALRLARADATRRRSPASKRTITYGLPARTPARSPT